MTIFSTFPPRLTLLKIITTQCHLTTCTDASAYSKNECSLARTNKGYTARFSERSEGPATFRRRSCRSHEKLETQSNPANKWTINFIQVWVYTHYKNEKVKLFIVT